MALNKDFKELFKALNAEKAEYLIIGSYALIYYTEPRFTKDLDIWVNPDPENAAKVWKALVKFGAPLNGVKCGDFSNEEMVYQIGQAPNRIDILMGIDGVSFSEAWTGCLEGHYGKEKIYIIGKKELIKNKKAMSRKKDLSDLEELER